ncbi:DUF2752 domain-containing protein [Labilibaculum manganireducens]|uniref:DUF2752 domain-containing protein n=1 Tax=Labilibaculum manganireducens TaxID=1940525 RepID=UPI0029F53A10|nr:DUF2752 domain-containing protein [Labilibaculum manganireducens]
MWQNIINWLENHLATCTFQKHFGIACPGCGLQTSLLALLKGDIWEAILLYPALIPILSMLTLLILHLKFKFSWGAIILKYLFFLSVFLVLASYAIKISSAF